MSRSNFIGFFMPPTFLLKHLYQHFYARITGASLSYYSCISGAY
jgi:hypothetical protein